jgi:hypothetical protein
MSGSRDALQLRAALSRYREQKRCGKYPSALRERAEAYARERSRAGAMAAEIAAELGVRKATADMWVSGGERSAESPVATPHGVAGLPLVPVVVRPERRDPSSMRLKLTFADGTRMLVSGIAGRDIAEAIEALRRTR